MGDRTRKTVFAAMFLAAAMNATVAAAASFDCAQALSATERLICSDASLGARDVILSRLYVAAIRKDPTGRIKAGQREWLAKAGTCGTAACLGKMYEGQIDRLLRTKGGNAAASHFFTEEPKGNHGTLDVVGPTDGFAYVSLVSTYVGPGGVEIDDGRGYREERDERRYRRMCRELRDRCENRDIYGEEGQGNCRRYRRMCG